MPTPKSEAGQRFRPFGAFLVSLRFLTRLPVPFIRTIDPPPLAKSMPYFAIVGALIGASTGMVLLGLNAAGLPSLLTGTLALAFSVLLTGALHEDGLADVADGFGGGKTREQRLAIMWDSRIGTYGTLALMIAMLARIFIYESSLGLPPVGLIGILAGAGGFSRAMMVDLLWATNPARDNGLSAYAGRPTRNSALFALFTGGGLLVATAAMYISAEIGVLGLIAAGLVTALLRRLAVRLVGGQTGDVCGAVQVLSEIAILTTCVASIG
jgi:adenosylcobinamide-GDP ribazoletransferase